MKRIILKGVNPNHFPEAVPVSDNKFLVTLAPDTQQTLQIPDDARYVIFNSDRNFYTSYNGDITIPDNTPGQVSTDLEYSPAQRYIADKSHIKLKSTYVTHVFISFYS